MRWASAPYKIAAAEPAPPQPGGAFIGAPSTVGVPGLTGGSLYVDGEPLGAMAETPSPAGPKATVPPGAIAGTCLFSVSLLQRAAIKPVVLTDRASVPRAVAATPFQTGSCALR